MKRSDLPTGTVLAIAEGWPAGSDLCAVLMKYGFPYKVARAALLRDIDAGLLEYGTFVERSWITPEGRRHLASLASS